ncbi:MAG: hypothetical protein RLZZ399_1286 [Verrucomicrobiota bacterium]
MGAEGAGSAAASGEEDPFAFARMPTLRQVQILERLEKQMGKAGSSAGADILMHRLLETLDADQLAGMLGEIPVRSEGASPMAFRIGERLAAFDVERALRLGTERGSREVLKAAISVLAQQDASAALQAIAALPENLRNKALDYEDAAEMGRPKGSLDDAMATLREHPALLQPEGASGRAVAKMLGQLAAEKAVSEPAQTLDQIRSAVGSLVRSNPELSEADAAKRTDRLVAQVSSATVGALREESLNHASTYFDALKDTEKTSWSLSWEAVSRYKAAGPEAAIRFAEQQTNPDFMTSAASGVWWALAKEDRASAIAWIESLPAGAFRQGSLRSVMMDAWNRNKAWGDFSVAVEASDPLQSRGSKVDYFAAVLSDRHVSGRDDFSQEEMIASLPLSEAEKQSLRSRLAPIRPR